MTKIIDISTGATLEDNGESEGVIDGGKELTEQSIQEKILNDLLSEFDRYKLQLSITEGITAAKYFQMSAAIFGCKEIAKKVFENEKYGL